MRADSFKRVLGCRMAETLVQNRPTTLEASAGCEGCRILWECMDALGLRRQDYLDRVLRAYKGPILEQEAGWFASGPNDVLATLIVKLH